MVLAGQRLGPSPRRKFSLRRVSFRKHYRPRRWCGCGMTRIRGNPAGRSPPTIGSAAMVGPVMAPIDYDTHARHVRAVHHYAHSLLRLVATLSLMQGALTAALLIAFDARWP